MTTEKKSENTETPEVNDNKTVFAPLGKYAIVAVIMVSIIITTAIMLDKQLNPIDQHLAAAEQEVVDLYGAESNAADANNTATTAEVATTETPVIAEIETTPATNNSEVVTATVATPAEEVPSAEVLVAQETPVTTIVAEADHNTAQQKSANQFELATAKSAARDRQAQLAKESQAQIEAYKAEHKKQLSEMFARIKVLEAKQLDRYKTNQDEQIVRLRGQVAQQQEMIEALVMRNKDSFELRSANVQRNQTNREQVLNRI